MSGQTEVGKGDFGRVSQLISGEKRTRLQEQAFWGLVDEHGATEKVFHALCNAMTGATLQVRVAEPVTSGSNGRGWTYAPEPDHPVRIAAARTMAQILGILKTNQGVTVNNDNRTLTLGQGDSLAQLRAVGVPDETVEAACRDLLASVSASKDSLEKTVK